VVIEVDASGHAPTLPFGIASPYAPLVIPAMFARKGFPGEEN
jgi:hypothetical protein